MVWKWLTCIDELLNISDTFEYSGFSENDGLKANEYYDASGDGTNAFQLFDETACITTKVHNMRNNNPPK